VCLTAASLLCTIGPVAAVDLSDVTVTAFERYARLTERRLDQEATGARPFLWVDGLAESRRLEAVRSLQAGEVVVSRLETQSDGQRVPIEGALCHHWLGTVFVPRVSLDLTVSVLQNYDRYSEIYQPAVRRSSILSRDGDHFVVSLQLFMKKIVGVVVNTESDVQYRRVSAAREQVRSVSTRIAEVESPGTAAEMEKPVGHDSGFLWRFNNYCSIEAKDGGTYMQCETLSLSRSIPAGLGWLIDPFVTSVPRESLEFTLTGLRRTLLALLPAR
jgi:hypothetical protein